MKKLLFTIGILSASVLGSAQTTGNALRYDSHNQATAPLPTYFGTAGSKSFTVEMWVQNEITDTYWENPQWLFSAQTDMGTFVQLILDKYQLSAYCVKGGVTTSVFGEIPDIRNFWVHIAMTYNAETNQLKIYLNGVDKTGVGTYTIKQPDFRTHTNLMMVGGWYFKGVLDEVHIWNYPLSLCQIKAGMKSDYTLPTPTGLMTAYNFNQGVESTDNTAITSLKDLKLSNHGTLKNFDLRAGNTTSNWITSSPNILNKTNVNPADNTNAVTQIDNTLTATLSGATYQWYYADNSVIINGATSQSFTPSTYGNYSVTITKNGCTQSSPVINYLATDIKQNTNDGIKISTNPQGETTIDLGETTEVMVEVFNLSGAKVDGFTSNNQSTIRFNINQPAGVYLLRITANSQTTTHKVIKK